MAVVPGVPAERHQGSVGCGRGKLTVSLITCNSHRVPSPRRLISCVVHPDIHLSIIGIHQIRAISHRLRDIVDEAICWIS
jgi:hypothetical protein